MKKIFIMLSAISMILIAGCKTADTLLEPLNPGEHRLRLEVNFPFYMQSKVAAMLLHIRYNPETHNMEGIIRESTLKTKYTNDQGFAAFDFVVNEENYYGYTIFQDIDNDDKMSTNDIVWGTNGYRGQYNYIFYTYIIKKDEVSRVKNWFTCYTTSVYSEQ